MKNEVCHVSPYCLQTGFVLSEPRSALWCVLCLQMGSFSPSLQFFDHFTSMCLAPHLRSCSGSGAEALSLRWALLLHMPLHAHACPTYHKPFYFRD